MKILCDLNMILDQSVQKF